MRIVLTSFRDAKNWKGATCSIARWQPDWSEMPEFPVDVKPVLNGEKLGEWMKPEEYREKYERVLKGVEEKLLDFFGKVENDETLVLCCWCNLERQKQFGGKLFCHRILLGWWIEKHFRFAIVKYADGAENPIWERRK